MNWSIMPAVPIHELSNGEFSLLSCEEYGLFERLRRLAWVNAGLSSNTESLQGLAASCMCSPHRFRKIWPTIRKLFTEIDGKLHYLADVEEFYKHPKRYHRHVPSPHERATQGRMVQ